ncbi:hypothetical protein MLD38_022725 [Melastoma candidum]|uniref:Uncharacterized protein n=1 Tax=Melastoma candidum TaxID=119954 RepID=A0ACB9QLE5_9MYRT|nr:hypothetical protein MLD38_022725 [Melastoma candidum]
MELNILTLITSIALLCILCSLIQQWRQCYRSSSSGPRCYPVVGCLVSFHKNRRRLLEWYTELLANSPTNTIEISRLGARRTIVTANANNVEHILRTNFGNYPKGRPFTEILGDFLGAGIFNVDGERWRMQRKLVSHEFSANSMREYTMSTLREEVKGKLFPILESLAREKRTIDMQDLLKRFAFDVVCKVSLGVEQHSLDGSLPTCPLADAFDISSEVCARRGAASVSFLWKVKRWLVVGSEKKLRDAVQVIHRHVDEAVEGKVKKMQMSEKEGGCSCSGGGYDMLSRMISAGYDRKSMRDMVISFIMAGRDTTSAAMTWLFWLLSQNPNIEEEVVKEGTWVLSDSNNNELGYDSLKELSLLKAVLYESMRLYPPVAWDSKHAVRDDVLPDGTFVKSGNRVTYFQYGMGRMETLWGKDRLEFKPERWFLDQLNKKGELRKICPYKFPVFQAGPRDCIGKEMAMIQMQYVVASILNRFVIRPADNRRPVFVPFLTAQMAYGFQVRVEERRISCDNVMEENSVDV